MSYLKLYIAVLDEVPDHMVPVVVAHAVLRAHKMFDKPYDSYDHIYDPTVKYKYWLNASFKKVVLKVNRKEFLKIKELDNVVLTHENNTLDREDCCAVLCPREEYPNVIKFAKMWAPNEWTATAKKQLEEVKRLELIVSQLVHTRERLEKQVSDHNWSTDITRWGK